MLQTKNRFAIAVGIIGIIAGSLGITVIAVFSVVFLTSSIFSDLRIKYDGLIATGAVVSTAIFFSSSLYIFSQEIQQLSHTVIRMISFGSLTFIFLFLNKRIDGLRFRKQLLGASSFSIASSICTLIPAAKLISFLGFGYDTYGHVYIFRNILIYRRSFVAINRPDEFVTFVGATPLGTHNLLALIAETIGIDGTDIHQSLSFFSLVVCLLPVLTVFIAVLAFKSTQMGKTRVLIGSLSITIVIVFGYPSHIWFSGFLTSNFSTFLMLTCACVAIFSKQKEIKLWTLAAIGIAQFVVYPLYAVFAVIPFVSVIVSSRGDLLVEAINGLRTHIKLFLLASFGLSALIFITLNGILSGFGGSQFLEPGGIAPLPTATTMFIYGISMAFMLNGNNGLIDTNTKAVVAGFTSLAIAGILYSYFKTSRPGELWFVSYYPTKLAISVLIVMVVLLFVQVVQNPRPLWNIGMKTLFELALVIAPSAALIVNTFNSWPFSQGYMGTTQGVIRSLRTQIPEVVDGIAVFRSTKLEHESALSVLYLSDLHESELNTRWINSLNLNWSDVNWGNWITARQLVDEGKLEQASEIINGNFIVVIDNFKKFNENTTAFSVFDGLCIFDTDRKLVCR